MSDCGAKRWEYKHEVSLGQIIQALTLIVMIGGAAFGSYMSLKSDLQAASEKAFTAISAMDARVGVLEARRELDDRFQTETARNLSRLLDAVSDIRVALGPARATPFRGQPAQ